MADAERLMDTLAGFAQILTHGYGVGDVLHDLAERVSEYLGLTGAGVTLLVGDQVRFVNAHLEMLAELERVQESYQAGPCVEAVRTCKPVTVADLAVSDAATWWPAYTTQALAVGIRAVAGIPMRTETRAIGAINLYDRSPRDWLEQDLRVVGILADIATGYLVHASEADSQRRLVEHLQQALDTRMIIEQAKGMLAATQGVSIDTAFQVLRKHARNHNARIHDVAHAVVHLGLRPDA